MQRYSSSSLFLAVVLYSRMALANNSFGMMTTSGDPNPFFFHCLATALALFLAVAASMWQHNFHGYPAMIGWDEELFARQSQNLKALRTSLTAQRKAMLVSVQQRVDIAKQKIELSKEQDNIKVKLTSLKAMLKDLRVSSSSSSFGQPIATQMA